MLILIRFQWWRDVTRESTFQGKHTIEVVTGLTIGIILFIVSEIFFFVSFFWAFFHRRLSPDIHIGGIWPPKGIQSLNPIGIPLLNTIILLTSGITVTWSHHSIILNIKQNAIYSLILTCILGIYFTALQIFEYMITRFTIADSVYGSVFFIATGFHGIHVLIGTLFLSVCLIRIIKNHFSYNHHLGFEIAIWYWHFVDVVWLFLYIFVYWWRKA